MVPECIVRNSENHSPAPDSAAVPRNTEFEPSSSVHLLLLVSACSDYFLHRSEMPVAPPFLNSR
eukprot:2713816-Karenia_brevis.AAC.1